MDGRGLQKPPNRAPRLLVAALLVVRFRSVAELGAPGFERWQGVDGDQAARKRRTHVGKRELGDLENRPTPTHLLTLSTVPIRAKLEHPPLPFLLGIRDL